MRAVSAVIAHVTEGVRARSAKERAAYLEQIRAAQSRQPHRQHHVCSNLAHAFAAAPETDKFIMLSAQPVPDIGMVSAYNDMLSAHQPLGDYPVLLKDEIRKAGAVAQFAGGVPAMCDGVTQGTPGMELSLFSRDVIAQATAIALAHNMFDGALLLGVCDKIVPGLVMGALHFGHLPCILIPAGPMPSGLSNSEKAEIRQLYAQGKVGSEALLACEARAYHSAGTCTFYGTANSNQMLMEILGLHIPGAAFINPGTPLREALTRAAARRITQITALGPSPIAIGAMLDERSFVNAIVGVLATGGSTNHTMHLIAMAKAAGIRLTWDDFAALSAVVPLLARVYPNGSADVNHFHAAGGLGFIIRELLDAGLLHEDVGTVMGTGLRAYTREPWLENGTLAWREAPATPLDDSIVRPMSRPFEPDGGLKLVQGNLGRAVLKTSAVPSDRYVIEAPVAVFDSQAEVEHAFTAGALDRDVIVVVRFQGPRANGMPELHKLTPALGVLHDKGYKVALVTDGRMSGASGKIPAAIHVSPECLAGGPLARLRDGDLVRLDALSGKLEALVAAADWNERVPAQPAVSDNEHGWGRELFSLFRRHARTAEEGGSALL
jgi:phosphogluconate dehydratase